MIRSRYVGATVLILLSINTVSSISLAANQENSTITIVGRDNPAAIPDGTAYAALFGVLRHMPSETTDRYNRRVAATIAIIGLTSAEGGLLLEAAENFAIEVKKHEARTTQVRQKQHKSLDEVQRLQNERDALAMMVLAELRAKLSVEGGQRLASHVQSQVKPHMVLVRRTK
ncbi:MAG: hypothetical protein AUH86_03155 [Acidobacteria bacterium 13_1_40CM_4_58_4]|nr:MAG: hypothetical protein AUH86_03155 [Acidobacteria bacterium 13_1_40CM_4_58_4]